MEEAELERQLINDTHSDCSTDDSVTDEEASGSETEVDEHPSSGQSL
jgi:hypothetical protein